MGLVQALTATGHSRSAAALCLPRPSLSGLIYIGGSGEPQTSERDKRGVSYSSFNLVEDLKLCGGEAAQQLEPRELGKGKAAEDLCCWCPTALETLIMPC